MSDYTKTFGPEKVERTSCFVCPGEPVSECEPCKPEPIPFPEEISKIVTGTYTACHETTGKPWLVQECLVWNAKARCWEKSSEGVVELPAAYKASGPGAPVILPSFDGVLEVFTPDGVVEVYGGDMTPIGMIGSIFCINGELCYVGYPPTEEIPEEVQIGGVMPEDDAGVKLWVDGGIVKYPSAAGWIQNTPFGA